MFWYLYEQEVTWQGHVVGKYWERKKLQLHK